MQIHIIIHTHFLNIQIDTPGSERSEASERSESVGHVPVHAKFIYLHSHSIPLLHMHSSAAVPVHCYGQIVLLAGEKNSAGPEAGG